MAKAPAFLFLPARFRGSKAIAPKRAETVDNYTKRQQRWQNEAMPRFLTLADVAEQLQINSPQAYALVRSGELKAIQVGGRGQWRIEEKMLEQYIEDRYAEAGRMIEEAKVKTGRS
ncbi:Putative DNA binding domain, excisionase family protein [Arthrobacter sp. 9V]|nr:Putative DNA binding domain, excisionase family protein [Arthrobacter sp. 9V]